MKKRIISFFTALNMTLMLFTGIPISVSAAVGDIEINETNFPDEKFREYINNNIDSDGNGSLSSDEIANTTEIEITGRAVKDLKGIEFFTELTSLKAYNISSLTTLDVSKNTKLEYLDCYLCSITELDVSKNTALTHLDCHGNNNKISKIDLSKNTLLTYFDCAGNPLTELDVSQNTLLTYLTCAKTNINKLDVSKNTLLTFLSCGVNERITTLDVSKNTELTELLCSSNSLKELDISKNTKLTMLKCFSNQITELDVSKNPELSILLCYGNQLNKLDVSNNTKLTQLNCQNNKIEELDLSNNTALERLMCFNNQLASVDVSKSTSEQMQLFNCGNNKHTVSTCVLDNDTLPAGFDLSKASGWSDNVEVTNDKVLYKGTGDVTYTYDCGKGKTETFTLVFPPRDLTKVEAKDTTCTEDGNIEYYKCSCGYKFGNANPTAADILSDEDVFTNKTGHDWSGAYQSDGSQHWKVCTKCNEAGTKENHAWDEGTVTTEPTEDTEGVRTYTCTVCSATKTEKIDKLEHTHDWSGAYQSDSSQHWKVCTKCNKEGTKENHAWGEGTVTTEPTETTEGVKTFTCTVCAKTKTENIAQLEHTHDWSDAYQSDGSQHWKVCTKCNEAGTKENHAWDSGTVTTQPTEDNEGVRTYTCTVCSATKTEKIDKLEHTHDWSNTYQSDGSQHWKVCTKCNEAGTKENHVWNDGIVTTEPTETSTGVKTYTCTVCAKTRTESIAQLEHTHTLTAHDAVPATCTTDGNEAYWTCSGCNKMFSDGNGTTEITAIPTIPATGHKFSTEWASDSTYHWYAATCGHDIISGQAAHTEDGGTVTIPPTTENDGVKTFACSVCGYVMRTVTIPKLDEGHIHSFSPDWKHDDTSHWHECDCGAKEDIAPHVEDGGVVTTEPTETSTGIMTYSCETCGYIIRTDIIPARVPEHRHNFGTDWKFDDLEHWHECECGEKSDIANHISSGWIVEIPATVEAEGVQIKRCTVCGIELDRKTIEKLPNISTGDVAEDVRDTAGTNAGLVQDNTLIENTLTPQDKTEVSEGHSFEIVLEVTDIRDSVPPADVAAASAALKSDEKIGIYVDLSLFKIKDNSERTPIYNTSGQIGITLTISESIYASDRTYSIIRVHDGIAENLGGTYDRTSRELTFYTDKFSTYAIAYTASNGGTDRPNVPDTPTKPTTPTVPSTPTNPSVPTYPTAPVKPVTPTVTETTVKKEDEVISDEPYVEDVSSAAGIYESGEADNNIHYVMILIFAAAVGIAVIAAQKHFCKKNMK